MITMEWFIYVIIFITGSFFGSFFTLAVYRLPRKEDIFLKHSYCPNCGHKLKMLDLFPLFSYLFLKGKCRYCKAKIRPRYFILEILSGIAFVLIAYSTEFGKNYLVMKNIILLGMNYIYISILVIIAGIDKENRKIQSNALTVGIFFEIAYITYLCTFNQSNVYQYVIYLAMIVLLLVIKIIHSKNSLKENYTLQILFLSLYIILFTGSTIYTITVILTLLSIAIDNIKSTKQKEIPIGFYLCTFNIIVYVIANMISNHVV